MALTNEEKARAKYHLGYPTVNPIPGLAFGVSVPLQPLFLVISALDKVEEAMEPKIREILGTLDEIECQLAKQAKRLAVTELGGGLKTNLNAPKQLEELYMQFAGRLADILSVPFYPFSERHKVGRMQHGARSIRMRSS